MFEQRCQPLRERFLHAGLDLSSGGPEEDRLVSAWLRADLREQRPADWRVLLPRAIALGREIYRSFAEAYSAAFLEADGSGVLRVRRFLHRRFGFVDPHAEEAVLERICDRRLVLLQHMRRKFQPSLFAARAFDRSLLPGYLARVAWLESLKVPKEDLPWNRARLDEATAGIEPVDEDAGVDYLDLSERVSAFWSKANGFSAEHHLEGVVSLGLGRLTHNTTLRNRCERLLAEKLPAWEARFAVLRRRSSQALARWEELRDRRAAAGPGRALGLEEKKAAAEERLRRCRVLLAQHPLRLRPRPAEVAQVLAGFVRRQAGGIRHDRIGREIALFRRRVCEGWAALLRVPAALPSATRALGEAIASHLGREPLSSRQHGLTAAEKQRRLSGARDWLISAADLLGQVRQRLAEHRATPAHASGWPAVEAWLCDAEDFYEFGVLLRKGVISGLGRRHGWRLHHLLRGVEPAPGRRSPGAPIS